jgi:hypothetical protein
MQKYENKSLQNLTKNKKDRMQLEVSLLKQSLKRFVFVPTTRHREHKLLTYGLLYFIL